MGWVETICLGFRWVGFVNSQCCDGSSSSLMIEMSCDSVIVATPTRYRWFNTKSEFGEGCIGNSDCSISANIGVDGHLAECTFGTVVQGTMAVDKFPCGVEADQGVGVLQAGRITGVKKVRMVLARP